MSDLSPERREELAAALYSLTWTSDLTDANPELQESYLERADDLAPLVADMLAAEREAGAAEVRARVETWWADFFGCSPDCDCRDARDLRSYLNGGESNV